MEAINSIIKEIIEYEEQNDGCLLSLYLNRKFLIYDLKSMLSDNFDSIDGLINFYKLLVVDWDNRNIKQSQSNKVKNLISSLEAFKEARQCKERL